ncbi:MAG: FliM/FliN family flagellar motor switch protein, partial [Bdellovibrio sp.]|nr:FliM/FliN family flagellar motor switch protein [Bdellovibrio sp.]
MAEPAGFGEMNLGEIGAALASAGAQAPGEGGAMGAPGPGSGSGQAAKPGAPPIQSLDFILDIPLKVTAELGRSKMAIRDILQLAQGSVI